MLQVRPGGPYLSAWWIMGPFPQVRAFVFPTREGIYFFVATFPLPAGTLGFKARFDGTLESRLRAARDRIDAMLAGRS